MDLEDRTLGDAVEAGMAQHCALGCDGDDEIACGEAKIAMAKYCVENPAECEGKCDTLPDGTQRNLMGCPALETAADKCAHKVKLSADLTGEARADAMAGVGTVCAEACDANAEDAESCAAAESSLKELCRDAPPGFCEEQCGKWDSPTTNRVICEAVGKPVP